MANRPSPAADPASRVVETAPTPRRPVSDAEQARREAWGKDSGAKVAAAYKQMGDAA